MGALLKQPVAYNPVIGSAHDGDQLRYPLQLSYWRGLTNPDLCHLPLTILPKQMEEIQAALRDALFLIQELKKHGC